MRLYTFAIWGDDSSLKDCYEQALCDLLSEWHSLGLVPETKANAADTMRSCISSMRKDGFKGSIFGALVGIDFTKLEEACSNQAPSDPEDALVLAGRLRRNADYTYGVALVCPCGWTGDIRDLVRLEAAIVCPQCRDFKFATLGKA